jgi:hypothetical protein
VIVKLAGFVGGAAVAAALLAASAPADADLIFTPKGGSTGDNVLFEALYTNQTSFFSDTDHHDFTRAVPFAVIDQDWSWQRTYQHQRARAG